MRNRLVLLLGSLPFLGAIGFSQSVVQTANSHTPRTAMIAAAAPTVSDRLPVRHVALYKNGVGYFEHDGRVRGSQTVTIAFTTAQFNDVLKSLTAIDLNGGRIADVSYNSTAPLEKRLNTLQIRLDKRPQPRSFSTRCEERALKFEMELSQQLADS